MIQRVARRYRFAGRHHVPDLPPPWNRPHAHDYTVEVVAEAQASDGLVVDTDALDDAWRQFAGWAGSQVIVDLDLLYGPENTTVEALSRRWLAEFQSVFGVGAVVASVTVWEDDDRWGQTVA